MIFEQDIKKERAQLWHTAETTSPLRTLDDAREFLNRIGFSLAYPVHPQLLAPTFIGAYSGSEEKLPTAKQAFADANARAATELIVRLLSEKSAFEVAFGDDASLLVSAAEFPYFYALIGDRNPKAAPSPGLRNEQALTTHTFEVIDQHGPISEDEMRRKLGREVSRNAIEKVLHTLWSKLRITRVDPGMENGEPVEPIWDLMHRFAPQMVNRGKQISAAEALSALISKYLEGVIVAEQKDVEAFFGRLVPRSKISDVCKALLAAKEFTYVQVSGKTMLRLASRGAGEEADPAPVAPEERKVRPWQAREMGKKAAEEKRARFGDRTAKPFQKFSKDRKTFGERKPFRKPFEDRPRSGPDMPSREGSEGSEFKKPFHERKPFGERKQFGDRSKPFGERKRFGDRPKPFGERKSFGDRKTFDERRPFRDRGPSASSQEGSERAKPFGPRKSFNESGKSFADRKAGARRSAPGDRPFRKPFGDKKSFGERKPFGDKRTFGERKSFGERPKKNFGDYPPRDRGESRDFKKPFSGKSSFGDKKSFGGKKTFGEKKSFGGGKSFGGKKPFGKPFGKRKPLSGDRPPSKREEPSE